MISTLTALLIVFAAVIGSSAMMGMVIYFLRRLRELEAKTGGELDSGHMVEKFDSLHEELLTVQQTVEALTERLDFTEKLLMSGDESASDGAVEPPLSGSVEKKPT